MWEADPEKLNICKLFWGTILFPLAFLRFRKVGHFIPRITLFFLVGAGLCAMLGLWAATCACLIDGAIFTIIYSIVVGIRQTVAERQVEKESTLSTITRRGSMIGQWISDHTIGPIFEIVWNAEHSQTGQKVGGFFAVIGEYVRPAKQRFCPLIRVN
ncbi:MAG: hypothetical protein HY093_03865 [Candidatus Liptonbacteria bacterium]|nr:hypothetical protein [Candidatus Liptonbacteria bacterium]